MRLSVWLFCLVFAVNLNAQNQKDKADDFYANGNFAKAIEAYKAVDNLGEVYDKIAKAYIAIGNYGEGLGNYKKALSRLRMNSCSRSLIRQKK